MRVIANHERCEGYGLCEIAAPSFYELDEVGKVRLLSPDADVIPADQQAAAAGARACPLAALRIEED